MPRWVAPKVIKKVVVQSDDAVRLSEIVSSILPPVNFALFPGETRFHCVAEIGVIGDLLIWSAHTETGYLASWQDTSSKRFELIFIEAGECRSATNSQNVRAVGGQACILYDIRDHRLSVAPGTRAISMSLPLARYSKLASVNGDPDRALTGFVPLLDATHPAAKVIRSILGILHAEGHQENPLVSVPLPAAILKEALLQALILSWPRVEAHASQRPAPRSVRRAIEWIERHLQDKITLEDIARAAGTGPRTLQAQFRHQTGMRLMQYVIKSRLHHVHLALSDAASQKTTSEIAYQWGFQHLGDFERYYKERYGQTPGETRRQARSLT